MSLEIAIQNLATALAEHGVLLNQNTAAIQQCIAAAGGTAPLAALPDPAPEEAPVKGRKRAAAAPAPEKAAEPEKPIAADPEPEAPASTFPTDPAAARLLIQDKAREFLIRESSSQAAKDTYAACLAKHGDGKATKVSQLDDSLLEKFYQEVCKL